MATRFGVVGTGYWAREIHIPGLLATENAEVVGLWGRTPSSVAAIAQRYGIRAFARLDDLLQAVDALSIAVHPHAQPGIAMAAAAAGKHVILEKPIAMEVTAARNVEAAIKKAKVANVVFFLRRFIPEIAAVIAAERHNGWDHAEVRVHSSVMVTDSPYRNSSWRREHGAALWDIGPHVLSVLIPMLGRVTSVDTAVANNHFVTMRTRHGDGRSAAVSLTLHSAPAEVANDYRFTSRSRDLLLPNPEVARVDAFGRAAARLIANIASCHHDDECDVRLGVEIVELLAQAEERIRSL
jgi:predicted dehydrogenase